MTHRNTNHFATQSNKIENLLRSRYGQWIPAYELSELALQYCARINSIRKKLRGTGEEIENKIERLRGQVHGSYRIRRKDSNEHRPAPQPSPKAIPNSPDWFERGFGPRPAAQVATSDLPLFAGSSL